MAARRGQSQSGALPATAKAGISPALPIRLRGCILRARRSTSRAPWRHGAPAGGPLPHADQTALDSAAARQRLHLNRQGHPTHLRLPGDVTLKNVPCPSLNAHCMIHTAGCQAKIGRRERFAVRPTCVILLRETGRCAGWAPDPAPRTR